MALSEQSIAEDTPISIVRGHDAGGLIRGHVAGHDAGGLIRVNCGLHLINLHVDYSEEGVRWIRGHHRDGTPAAEALLAAYKLSRMVE